MRISYFSRLVKINYIARSHDTSEIFEGEIASHLSWRFVLIYSSVCKIFYASLKIGIKYNFVSYVRSFVRSFNLIFKATLFFENLFFNTSIDIDRIIVYYWLIFEMFVFFFLSYFLFSYLLLYIVLEINFLLTLSPA